jgi:tryptophan synthase alpha chain
VGITGTQQSVAADAAALVARIRRWTGLPVAVGFGISNSEHVAQVAEFADAVVIGSAIVELIERSIPETGVPADRSSYVGWETAPAAVARFIKGLHLSAAADGAGPVRNQPLASSF